MAIVEREFDPSRRDFFTLGFARRRGSGGQPPRRPTAVDTAQAEPPDGGFKVTRRQAIIVGGTVVAGSAMVTVVRLWEWMSPDTAKKLDPGRQKLNDELDNLPNSPIKSLLLNRVRPYYQQNPPETVTYDGLEVKVSTSKVILKTQTADPNLIHGEFKLRGESFNPEKLFPAKPTTIRLPYTGLLLESDRSILPPANLTTDGTLLINVQFPVDKPLYEGLSPQIIIVSADRNLVATSLKKAYENLVSFAFIKEACSHLLFDLWMEEVIRKMYQTGLTTFIEVKRADGTNKPVEAITQSINVIGALTGRFIAALDLAGYLIAFKAIEGTSLDDPNSLGVNLQKVRPNMQTVSLGEIPQEILYNSLHWALTTPEALTLSHKGDLNKIP